MERHLARTDTPANNQMCKERRARTRLNRMLHTSVPVLVYMQQCLQEECTWRFSRPVARHVLEEEGESEEKIFHRW
jgi:hypothetical protein